MAHSVKVVLFCGVLLLTPSITHAQAPPSPEPNAASDVSAVVQELDVIGRRPGPALWRVTRGDSEVVILGGLSPIPHLQQWNPIRVQRALQGASALFVAPNKPHVGLLDAAAMIFRQGALKPAHGVNMETTLPPALRERFDRVRDGLHLNAKPYQRWKPAVAGLWMIRDFHRAAGLSDDKPGTTVVKLAQAAHVTVKTVGAINLKPLFDSAARMSDAQNQECLSAALDDIERESSNARIAADDWAIGDLKGVRANMSASLLDRCLLQTSSGQSLVDRGTADAVKTIDGALAQPGRSVAVVDLSFLLRRNGVLDRLKAQGDQVTVPAE